MKLPSFLTKEIPINKLKFESRALKYGYSNARVSAMKGLLLSASQISELIKTKNPQSIMELLQKTSYKSDISEAAIVRSGFLVLELAFAKNFAKTAQKLLKIIPKSDQILLQGLLFKWYLLNLKIIMQAKIFNETFDQIETKLFIPDKETRIYLRKILSASNNDLAKIVKSYGIGAILFSKWNRFSEAFLSPQKFFEFENEFDSILYSITDTALAVNPATQSIRNIFKKEADYKNILLVLRMKKMNISKDKIKKNMIKGGLLNWKKLENIYDIKSLTELLNLVPSLDSIEIKDENLVNLEIELEKSIASSKLKAFHKHILSVGSILGFLLLKEQEINNLRKIIKAKEHKIPENEVQKMLVF